MSRSSVWRHLNALPNAFWRTVARSGVVWKAVNLKSYGNHTWIIQNLLELKDFYLVLRIKREALGQGRSGVKRRAHKTRYSSPDLMSFLSVSGVYIFKAHISENFVSVSCGSRFIQMCLILIPTKFKVSPISPMLICLLNSKFAHFKRFLVWALLRMFQHLLTMISPSCLFLTISDGTEPLYASTTGVLRVSVMSGEGLRLRSRGACTWESDLGNPDSDFYSQTTQILLGTEPISYLVAPC